MLTLLPLLCFFAIFLVLRRFQRLGWRGSFLLAVVFWGFLLTGLTELLSFFKGLDFWPVAWAWGMITLLLGFILVSGSQKLRLPHFNLQLNLLSRFERSLLVYLFLMAVVIGMTAWVAPPNTWDSMTYHMSRVMHWIQNKSVDAYPTNILRQLVQNPWNEYAIMHFQILAGSDRFANFIQWSSMFGSLVGVSLLAKELKATPRGQIFAAVACATIPMGILQGSSTQTDYGGAFWLVCMVYFAMLLRKKANLLVVLGLGGALGLCILTKATGYVFAFPFLAWLGLTSIMRRDVKQVLWIGLSLMVALTVNFGHFARNYDLMGNPLGFGQGNPAYTNEVFTVPALTSNLIRNVGLHLKTSFDPVNTDLEKVIYRVHQFIGISPNDVRTTWAGEEFHVLEISLFEDTASNPIHLFLIAMMLPIYCFQRPRDPEVVRYILCLLLAFVLFCLILKWQPWNSRLHLPLFVLFAPLLGLLLSRIQNGWIANSFVMLLVLAALPWVLRNGSRPLLEKNNIFTTSRIEQYFINRPNLSEPYSQSTQILSELHCSDVGLMMGEDDWEYPLWILLNEKTTGTIRLEHIQVNNNSRREVTDNQPGTFTPCAILSVNIQAQPGVLIGDKIYLHRWSAAPVSIYTPEN